MSQVSHTELAVFSGKNAAAPSTPSSDVDQPREVPSNQLDRPLYRLPEDRHAQYKEYLRYKQPEVERAVLQSAIDRSVQTGLSRGAQRIAEREVGQGENTSAPSATAGTTRATSTLQKQRLLKHQQSTLLTCSKEIETSFCKLQATKKLAEVQEQLGESDLGRHPDDDAAIISEVSQQLVRVKAFADDALKLLDVQIEQLETCVRYQESTPQDLAFLEQAKADRATLENALLLASSDRDASSPMQKCDTALEGVGQLSEHLQKMTSRLKGAENPDKLPPGLQGVADDQTIRKAGKPLVESLSDDEQRRLAESRRFGQLSKPLAIAVSGGLVKISAKTRLSPGGANVGPLDHKGRRAVEQDAQNHQRSAKIAKAIIAFHTDGNTKCLAGIDDHLLPRLDEDADAYVDRLLNHPDRRRVNRFVHAQVHHLARTIGKQPSAAIKSLVRQYDHGRRTLQYARVICAAHAAGLNLSGLDPPPVGEDGKLKHAEAYAKELGHTPPADFIKTANACLKDWKKEYLSLRQQLKPNNVFQKMWVGLKNKFFSKRYEPVAAVGSLELVLNEDEVVSTTGSASTTTEAMDVGLHTFLAINSARYAVNVRHHRHRLQQKAEVGKQNLKQYQEDRKTMEGVDAYRSGIRGALYEKTGDQSVLGLSLAEHVAYLQVARNTSAIISDALAKAGTAAHIAKVLGQASYAGAAVATLVDGIASTKQSIDAAEIKRRMEDRLKEIKTDIAHLEELPKSAENDEQLASLRQQQQNLEDISGQQELLLKILKAVQNYGTSAAFTMLLVGTITGVVGATVLMAIVTGMYASLTGYQCAKNQRETWQLEHAEDVVLGRGVHGDSYHKKLVQEAEQTGLTQAQVALRWISNGKDGNTRRPSARRFLASLKLETQNARATDRWVAETAQTIAENERMIATLERMDHTPGGNVDQATERRAQITKLRQQVDDLRDEHFQKILNDSPTARTLCAAYGMKPAEIVAIVDAPNNDEYDELGIRLISEYHQELIHS